VVNEEGTVAIALFLHRTPAPAVGVSRADSEAVAAKKEPRREAFRRGERSGRT